MRILLAGLAALFLATSATAEWHQASSAHYLIYSDEKPERLRDFATKLERFDQAARALYKMPNMPLSRGNRLTIFVLPNDEDVRKLHGDTTGFVAGFYKPNAAGSVAFVPRRIDGGGSDSAQLILLHEIAHHLMLQNLSTPYPEWMIEGFAEFLSTAKFERNGAVGLGLPAAHRAHGLLNEKPLPLEALLSGRYEKINQAERESIYGRGWLLSHYLTFERLGQRETYLAEIARGADPLEAARTAFGDLAKLNRDLENYLRRSKLRYWEVKPAQLNVGPIEITRLTAGGTAVMPFLIELKNNRGGKGAADLAARLRPIARQFPGDPLVETTLAEVELGAENAELAEAAADRALAADAQSTDAMLLKGRAMLERVRNSDDPTPAQFSAARSWFTRANKLDPEDPEPLLEFYKSFLLARQRPTANAIAALHYASDLAPQDPGLRLNSALQYLRDGKLKEARVTLAPIAYDPHGRQTASVARAMIAKIDAGDAKAAEQAATTGFTSE